MNLTAQTQLFVGAVPAVVQAVTHPALAHTQSVGTLELAQGTPTAPWVTSSCRGGGGGGNVVIQDFPLKHFKTLDMWTCTEAH